MTNEIQRFYEATLRKPGSRRAFLFRYRADNFELGRLHATQCARNDGFEYRAQRFLGTDQPPRMGEYIPGDE